MLKLTSGKKRLLIEFIGVISLLFLATAVSAQETVMGGTSCTANGNCELSDFMKVAIQVSKIILGLSGSAALLAFVAGGVMFLASAGNKTWIDRGKAAITGAVIGLVIVFASYMIIGFIITNLSSDPRAANWFQSDWFTK